MDGGFLNQFVNKAFRCLVFSYFRKKKIKNLLELEDTQHLSISIAEKEDSNAAKQLS